MRVPASRLLFAPVLVALLTPGLVEAAENLWHVAAAGHPAHAVDAGRDHRPRDEEHGCTGTFHLCSCHQAPAWRLAAASQATVGLSLTDHRPARSTGHRLDGHHATPFHPPRA